MFSRSDLAVQSINESEFNQAGNRSLVFGTILTARSGWGSFFPVGGECERRVEEKPSPPLYSCEKFFQLGKVSRLPRGYPFREAAATSAGVGWVCG